MSNLSVENLNISGNITTPGTVTAGNISTTGTISYSQLVINSYPKGTIIEQLSSICDGSQLTGASGTFTWPEVTAQWIDGNNSNTFETMPGSSITYIPPPAATKVIYKLTAAYAIIAGDPINYMDFVIDNVSVRSYEFHLEAIQADRIDMEFVINCNADTEDLDKAYFTSWTTSKTLAIKTRRYNTSHYGEWHAPYRPLARSDGQASLDLSKPVLTLTAIA
jgi:hypothetical protein